MTDRQHDLALVDRRGVRAGQAARTAAAQVDTSAMFERIRHRHRRRWMAPVVAVTATVAAVAVAILMAVQPPVTVGGLDPASGGGAPAGLETQEWPPAVGTVGPAGWIEVPPERVPTPGDPQDLEVMDGTFVLATEGGQVWASEDGFAWAEIPGVGASMGQRLFVSRAGRALLVATGEGTMFAGDVSGVDQVAEIGQVEALAGGPAGAVAVTGTPDQGRQVLATTDGRTWTPVDGLDQPLRSVAWDGSGFVGVTDGPDAQVLEAEQADGPWVAHPGSGTLPSGFWGVEPTEPGFVLIPRADGHQGLDPILWWTDEGGWDTTRLPGDGPIVIHDATTIDDQALVVMGTDASRPELDADRLYRIDRDAPQTSVVETSDAFGPTAVLRRAHAVSDGTTAMVAYGRRRAGPGDGLTLWVHRPVDHQGEDTSAHDTVEVTVRAEADAREENREHDVGEVPGGHGTLTIDSFDLIVDDLPDSPLPPPSVSVTTAEDPSVLPTIASTHDGFDRVGQADDITTGTFTTEAGEWQALYVPTTDSSVTGLQITENTLIQIHAPQRDLEEIEHLARLLDITHRPTAQDG